MFPRAVDRDIIVENRVLAEGHKSSTITSTIGLLLSNDLDYELNTIYVTMNDMTSFTE